jgi:hypothetical protein
MPYKKTGAPMGSARGPRSGAGRRGAAGPAMTVLLTAGVLCLAACGGGSSATKPAPAEASTPASTPSAQSPSTPAISPSAAGSAPSPSKVTAAAASASDIAQFTSAAAGKCGFTTSADKLTNAKVTNNGWGSATVTAKNPADQGNESIVFQTGTGWNLDKCGSEFSGEGIPQNVLDALGL